MMFFFRSCIFSVSIIVFVDSVVNIIVNIFDLFFDVEYDSVNVRNMMKKNGFYRF